MTEKYNFVQISNPFTLIPLLKRRLPKSCSILNQVLSFEKFGKDLEIYVVGSGTEEEDTWILVKWYREDWNFWTSISTPLSIPEHSSTCIQFRNFLAFSGVINWNSHSFFSPLERLATKMVLSAYVDHLESILTTQRWQLFYMTPEQGLKLEVSPKDKNVRVGHLTVATGVPFIGNNWKYGFVSTTETVCEVVRKLIERHPSSGVFVKDEEGNESLVCAALLVGNGQLGMLRTDPAHRKKGYASLCCRYLFKQMANLGMYPCIGTEVTNKGAIALYHSIKELTPVEELMTFISVEVEQCH